jgi:UDP-N-acetylmuramoyl-L-alanyl-D-glutamate--2,6-diaminopimelate ligase
MGEVAGRYADVTILTTDNPRFEAPEEILREIEAGIRRTDGAYRIIVDRQEAIRYALRERRPGDVILIAGKGHETYQEIRGVKYPMDDRELVRKCTQTLL